LLPSGHPTAAYVSFLAFLDVRMHIEDFFLLLVSETEIPVKGK
jgi:hypothetical protein